MHERKVTGTEFGVVVRARREAKGLDLPSDLMLNAGGYATEAQRAAALGALATWAGGTRRPTNGS